MAINTANAKNTVIRKPANDNNADETKKPVVQEVKKAVPVENKPMMKRPANMYDENHRLSIAGIVYLYWERQKSAIVNTAIHEIKAELNEVGAFYLLTSEEVIWLNERFDYHCKTAMQKVSEKKVLSKDELLEVLKSKMQENGNIDLSSIIEEDEEYSYQDLINYIAVEFSKDIETVKANLSCLI